MQLDFYSVLFTVLSLVLLMIPGYIISKTKMVGESAQATLSTIVLYVSQPMLMIMSFQKANFTNELVINLLIVAGLTLVVHLIMIGFALSVIKGKEKVHNVMRFASIFSNCAYMGLPFLQLLFKNNSTEILMYGGIISSVFNLLNWSIGAYIMSGDKAEMSFKKAFLNPTVLAVFLGILLFVVFQKPIVNLTPEDSTADMILTKLMNSIDCIGNTVTPLSMMVIGMKLTSVNLKTLFLNKQAYISCACKLILMSLISILVVSFLNVDILVKYAVFFTLSMPSASATVMFAVKYDSDGQSASVFVLLSTLLSTLTIPLMFTLFKVFLGM